MKRILTLIFVLVVLFLGLFFGLRNAGPVTVDYYFGAREIALSFLLVLMLIAGAFCGVLASLGHILRLRREMHRLRRDQRHAEQELGRLRELPARERV